MQKKWGARIGCAILAVLAVIFGRHLLALVLFVLLVLFKDCGLADEFRSKGLLPAGAKRVLARRDFTLNGDGYKLLYYEVDPATFPADEQGWRRPVDEKARDTLKDALRNFKVDKSQWPDFASPELEYVGDRLDFRDRRTGQVWHVELTT